jgi:hypothetical protein
MSKLILAKKEHETRTYEDLLAECRRHWYRAIEIIPTLYNRLTLVDGYSHKRAMSRMLNDLGDLPGFSRRTMIRYLPSDNANVPRRVRALTPEWRKNSVTKTQMADIERENAQMASEINTLQGKLSQADGTIRGQAEELANTHMELQTRDFQLRKANETTGIWEFVAWLWFFKNEKNEIAHEVTLNGLLEKCQRLSELQIITRGNEAEKP